MKGETHLVVPVELVQRWFPGTILTWENDGDWVLVSPLGDKLPLVELRHQPLMHRRSYWMETDEWPTTLEG